MIEIVGGSYYSKLDFKLKERPIDVTHKRHTLSVGKTIAFYCEMVRKLPDLVDCPVIVKMKFQRGSSLPHFEI